MLDHAGERPAEIFGRMGKFSVPLGDDAVKQLKIGLRSRSALWRDRDMAALTMTTMSAYLEWHHLRRADAQRRRDSGGPQRV